MNEPNLISKHEFLIEKLENIIIIKGTIDSLVHSLKTLTQANNETRDKWKHKINLAQITINKLHEDYNREIKELKIK